MIHSGLNRKTLECDFCVIGGGLSGFCAAIAAAREGASVVLVHDRPVLGGNASSEIRMCIGGIRDMRYREGGLMEELFLENAARNPYCRYPFWDIVLYDMVVREPNIRLLLNCTCLNAETEDSVIRSVDCYMMPSQTWYTIRAAQFADCSGDSILAPLTGAEFMAGREGRAAFGEAIAPEEPDNYTLGSSIMMHLERTDCPEPFTEPDWADHFPADSKAMEHRTRNHAFTEGFSTNFWWLERGGTRDTIADADEIRHSLMSLALGVYGHLKNAHADDCRDLTMNWLGALPGKRESRRYIGPVILTSTTITEDTAYPDTVAYGGWPMDNHDPRGFDNDGPGNVCYPVPMPYQIPLRCLYSVNIRNLWFAGRNISVSHEALTSTRVSATCAVLGQAVGTAAAHALKKQLLPGELTRADTDEIRRTLLLRDCYLPEADIPHAPVMDGIEVSGTAENPSLAARGRTRDLGETCCTAAPGDTLTYAFPEKREVHMVELYFDSDFERKTCTDRPWMAGSIMNVHSPVERYRMSLPMTLPKDFDVVTGEGAVFSVRGNIHRHVSIPLAQETGSVTFRLISTTGNPSVSVCGMELT